MRGNAGAPLRGNMSPRDVRWSFQLRETWLTRRRRCVLWGPLYSVRVLSSYTKVCWFKKFTACSLHLFTQVKAESHVPGSAHVSSSKRPSNRKVRHRHWSQRDIWRRQLYEAERRLYHRRKLDPRRDKGRRWLLEQMTYGPESNRWWPKTDQQHGHTPVGRQMISWIWWGGFGKHGRRRACLLMEVDN